MKSQKAPYWLTGGFIGLIVFFLLIIGFKKFSITACGYILSLVILPLTKFVSADTSPELIYKLSILEFFIFGAFFGILTKLLKRSHKAKKTS